MTKTFAINWSLTEASWDILGGFARKYLPGSEFDLRGTAIHWSPSSPIQMTYGVDKLLLDEMRIAPLSLRYAHEQWAAEVTRRRTDWSPPHFGLLPIAETLATSVESAWFRNSPGGFDVYLADGESPSHFRIRKLWKSRGIFIQYRWLLRIQPFPRREISDDPWWPYLEMDYSASEPLHVPEDAFLVGVRHFLTELSTEVFTRYPELRAWESFEPFLEYEGASG